MPYDNTVDVSLNRESLIQKYKCQINAVTKTALVKKEYLADVPGANGVVDLSSWFGTPRFEPITLTVYVQSDTETAISCADRLANFYIGKSVEVRLSFDYDWYRTGVVTNVTPLGSEVVIAIRCDPYRYADQETVYEIPASTSEVGKTLANNGSLPVVPSVTVADANVVIVHGTARYTLSKGTHLLPRMVISGGSSVEISVSGGACEIRYREAVL